VTVQFFEKTCDGHGESFDVRSPGTLFEFIGWAERSRRGGGLHHFKFKQQTGRVLCADCARRRAATGNVNQGSFL
jgi:hypothetical protein